MKKLSSLVALFLFFAPAHGQTISTFAGNGMTGGIVVNDTPAIDIPLPEPYCTSFDAHGNVYIADDVERQVYRVDSLGRVFVTAGTGLCSYCDTLVFHDKIATNADIRPQGVCTDSHGDLFILSEGNILKLKQSTGTLSTVAKTMASFMSIDKHDNLYLVKYASIYKIFADDSVPHQIAGTGTPGFSGDGGPALSAQFDQPHSICIDNSGNIYVADGNNNRVRKIDGVTMNISTFAGNGGLGFTGDNIPATIATVYGPQSVAVDENSNVFIADFLNKRIRKVDAITGLITTVAGNGTHGYSGDGGDAIAAEIGYAYNVAVDRCNNVYICDMDNHRVRKVTYDGGACYYSTGVADVMSKSQINMYPNPVIDQLNFTSTGKITSIEITDQLGRKLFSQNYFANDVSINVSSLSPGIYLANINHVQNRLFVKR